MCVYVVAFVGLCVRACVRVGILNVINDDDHYLDFHTPIHTHTDASRSTHVHTSKHTRTHTCMYINACSHTHTHTYTHVNTRTHTCTYIHACSHTTTHNHTRTHTSSQKHTHTHLGVLGGAGVTAVQSSDGMLQAEAHKRNVNIFSSIAPSKAQA